MLLVVGALSMGESERLLLGTRGAMKADASDCVGTIECRASGRIGRY